MIIWHQPVNGGFVATVNAGFRATGKSDVVVVNSDVIVGPGWLERLKATAYTSSTVATVTPLTNHGTVLSVGGGRNSPHVGSRTVSCQPRLPSAWPKSRDCSALLSRRLWAIASIFVVRHLKL